MKVLLGADHRGYELKSRYKHYIESIGYEVEDVNEAPLNPEDDYPLIAASLVNKLLAAGGQARGVLICGSGQGMAIAANRFKGIRACLCWNETEAKSSRNEDDSNILCLSTDHVDYEQSIKVISVWLSSEFAAASRYQRRIKELDELS